MAKHYYDQAFCDRVKRLRELGFSQREVAIRCKVGQSQISRLERRGYTPTDFGNGKRRPMPHDFRLYADRERIEDLLVRFRADNRTVARWLKEAGIKRPSFRPTTSPKKRPIPTDLADVLARMSIMEAMAHYGVARDTLRNWRIAKGLPFASRGERARQDKAKLVQFAPITPPPGYEAMKRKLPPVRSLYEVAA